MENSRPTFPTTFPDIDSEIEFFQKKEHYLFVPEDNVYMQAAAAAAIKYSQTPIFPIGIVAVKDGKIIVEAGNGNGYHEKNQDTPGHRKGCVRRYLNDERETQGLQKFRSGEGFELCPGCHTDSHAEANLTRKAKEVGVYGELRGADIYMYGHFWCCKNCWEKMSDAQVKNVFLPETADKFKDKEEVAKWVEEVKLARTMQKNQIL